MVSAFLTQSGEGAQEFRSRRSQLSAAVDAVGRVNLLDLGLDRVDADRKGTRNLLIAPTTPQELEDPLLLLGERFQSTWTVARWLAMAHERLSSPAARLGDRTQCA